MEGSVRVDKVNVLADLSGPPVATCFGCDRAAPVRYMRWYGELSAHGQVVALLPYCEGCVLRRECKQAEQRLEVAEGRRL